MVCKTTEVTEPTEDVERAKVIFCDTSEAAHIPKTRAGICGSSQGDIRIRSMTAVAMKSSITVLDGRTDKADKQ